MWWANLYAGGTVSTTVDYRPDGTSAIAFILKGPMMTDLPGGSVSYTVVVQEGEVVPPQVQAGACADFEEPQGQASLPHDLQESR